MEVIIKCIFNILKGCMMVSKVFFSTTEPSYPTRASYILPFQTAVVVVFFIYIIYMLVSMFVY